MQCLCWFCACKYHFIAAHSFSKLCPASWNSGRLVSVVPCPPSSGTVTINPTTQLLTQGIDGHHLAKTFQSLSVSMASNPVLATLAKALPKPHFVFNPLSTQAILVLLLACVYISLVEAKPKPIFDIARIFSPIAAGLTQVTICSLCA